MTPRDIWELVQIALVMFVLIHIGTVIFSHQERLLPVSHQVKAQSLAVGKRSCALDIHEACLVCLHREVQGILVSTYC